MSQSALGTLTTVGTEFNYWTVCVGAGPEDTPTRRVSYLKHAKVIDVSDDGWVDGTYIITAETEDDTEEFFRVNLENVDTFDIDWDTPSPDSDFTPIDIVIEALDLLYETQAHNIDNYVNDEDDITLEDIKKAKFWAEECNRITKIHYPEEFTR